MSNERLVKVGIYTSSNGVWHRIAQANDVLNLVEAWRAGVEKLVTLTGRVDDIDANKTLITWLREEITAVEVVEINQEM